MSSSGSGHGGHRPARRTSCGPPRLGPSVTTASRSHHRARLAVVLSGWPRGRRRSPLNELLALQRAGMLAAVFATKAGRLLPSPAGDRRSSTRSSRSSPTWMPPPRAAIVAPRLAGDRCAGGPRLLRPPARRGRGARRRGRLGVPYGFSVHALDVRKVAGRRAGAPGRPAPRSSCPCNADAAAAIASAGTPALIVRHGVDLERFPRSPPPDDPTTSLLAVGRLVEKKGFDVLVDALDAVDAAVGASASSATARNGRRLERPWRRLGPGRPGRAAGPAHPRRAARRSTRAPTSSSSRRSSTGTATATGCRTSCSRRWPAAGRSWPATWPPSRTAVRDGVTGPARPARRPRPRWPAR